LSAPESQPSITFVQQMRAFALLAVTAAAALNAPCAQADGGSYPFARGKLDHEKTYGRRITASPGESVIATIQLKGANRRDFANDQFPVEPLSLSVINLAEQSSFGFNFLVRDSDKALLGMGDWNGYLVDWAGQDTTMAPRLSLNQLQEQLRYDGLELPVAYALDRGKFGKAEETFRKRFERKYGHQNWEGDRYRYSTAEHRYSTEEWEQEKIRRRREQYSLEMVLASDTECYKTIAWLNGFGIPLRQRERHNAWKDNLERHQLDYFTHEDLDGCVKRAMKDGMPALCYPIEQRFELMALGSDNWVSFNYQDYKSTLTWSFLLNEHKRKEAGFTIRAPGSDMLGMLAENFLEDFATYGLRNDLCNYGPFQEEEVEEAVDYWDRQLRKYLPSCTLMFDRAAEPYRLSGFCHEMSGGRVSVEFELEPESAFLEEEGGRQAPGGDYYHEGSHHYHNTQYNSYHSDPEWGGRAMRRIGFLVLLGLCAMAVMAWSQRKGREHRE